MCYSVFRETLFKYASSKSSNFSYLSKSDKLVFLMNCVIKGLNVIICGLHGKEERSYYIGLTDVNISICVKRA